MLANRVRMGSKTEGGFTVTFRSREGMGDSYTPTEGYFEYSIDGGNTFINLSEHVVNYSLPSVVVKGVEQLIVRGDITGFYMFYLNMWVNGVGVSELPYLDTPYVNEILTEDLDIELYLGM